MMPILQKILLRFSLLIALIFSQNLFAQESALNNILNQNKYVIERSASGDLSGNGLEFLIKEADLAHFFLIGEKRFTREIPSLISSLYKSFSTVGYGHLALEVGPIAAKELEALSQADKEGDMRGFFSELPNSIPYYDHIQEAQLLMDASKIKAKLWGLDQESGSSARHLFKKLEALSQNKKQQEASRRLFNQAKSQFATDTLMLVSAWTESQQAELKELFRKNRKTQNVIRQLEESWRIFDLFQKRKYYESNALRNRLMKTYFNRATTEIKNEPLQKMMLKVSTLLAGRGKNDLGFFSLGNFVSEYAQSINSDSFHLLLTGKSYLRDSTERKLPQLDPELKVLDPLSSYTNITVFDLRPLRKQVFLGRLKNLPEDFIKMVYAYDAVLVLPKLTHALEKFD